MSGERTRILVIDDDAELARIVGAALEAEGYECIVASSARVGLELAHSRHPHLILLDVGMPDMGGRQVCRELQFGHSKDIPVVLLGTRQELHDAIAVRGAVASGRITKPLRPEHLTRLVRDLLRDALVFYDDITLLPTPAQVQAEVQRRFVQNAHLGMLYVTLEGIGALEQTQGFEVVDDVFRTVARRLIGARGSLLREDDLISVATMGNGFLILLSPSRDNGTLTEDHVFAVKRRLEQQLVEGLEEELESALFAKLGLFVGHARLTQSPKVRFRRALLEAVDSAVASLDRERDEAQHRLRQEFDRVLEGQEISCVFQPILRLDGYEVIGYELLARGPEHTELHAPEVLFEVARQQGRVADLDRVCRMTAARHGCELPARYLRFINTEPISLFFHARSHEYIREFIAGTPEALRSKTVIEITENAIIEDFEHMREVLRRIRGEGFLIAIDDAGAGYSGLQKMVEVESDFIKLDMSLTRTIEESVVRQRLVGTLRDFCQDAQIRLVAEGIETYAQLDVLRALGVGHGQGFLFAFPGSPYPLREIIPPLEGRSYLPPSGTGVHSVG